MSNTIGQLEAIRSRLAAATPGPWLWDEKFDPDKDGDSGLALTNADGVEIVGAYNHHCCAFRDDPIVKEEDAPLIANAPTDIARLLAAIDAVSAALDDWQAAAPFPDAEKSQQWYSLGKRHAAERIRFEIAEALK